MRLGKNRGDDERQSGGQLLHRAAHHRMRLGLMAALQDGTERPSGAADLQQQEAAQQRPAETLTHGFGRDQQDGAGQPHQHSDNGRAMQARAAGNERFDTDHPERRDA